MQLKCAVTPSRVQLLHKVQHLKRQNAHLHDHDIQEVMSTQSSSLYLDALCCQSLKWKRRKEL